MQPNFGGVGSEIKPTAGAEGETKTPRPRSSLARLKILALATYPKEAAATRFRLEQFVQPLAALGIDVEVRPFLDAATFTQLYDRPSRMRIAWGVARSLVRRCRDLVSARGVDAVFVQREAMLLGPPVVEYLIARVFKKPMILDLDDATYLRYQSPTYGRWAGVLKCFGKTNDLIRWSRVVICGNRVIADYVEEHGRWSIIIPTVVDTDRFCPRNGADQPGQPVLGWIGSHSTFPYLESIFPALERLARDYPFRLRIVGSGRDEIRIPGVSVECSSWSLEREVADFRSLDIGLYPIVEDPWSAGKSGFKAIQYMAVAVPFVVSPVGACTEIGEPGLTHFAATSPDEWYDALRALLIDPALRWRMGTAGRTYSLRHYTVLCQAEKLAGVMTAVVEGTALPV